MSIQRKIGYLLVIFAFAAMPWLIGLVGAPWPWLLPWGAAVIFLTRSASSRGVLISGTRWQRGGDLLVGLILAVGAAVFIGLYPHAMGLSWGGH